MHVCAHMCVCWAPADSVANSSTELTTSPLVSHPIRWFVRVISALFPVGLGLILKVPLVSATDPHTLDAWCRGLCLWELHMTLALGLAVLSRCVGCGVMLQDSGEAVTLCAVDWANCLQLHFGTICMNKHRCVAFTRPALEWEGVLSGIKMPHTTDTMLRKVHRVSACRVQGKGGGGTVG